MRTQQVDRVEGLSEVVNILGWRTRESELESETGMLEIGIWEMVHLV